MGITINLSLPISLAKMTIINEISRYAIAHIEIDGTKTTILNYLDDTRDKGLYIRSTIVPSEYLSYMDDLFEVKEGIFGTIKENIILAVNRATGDGDINIMQANYAINTLYNILENADIVKSGVVPFDEGQEVAFNTLVNKFTYNDKEEE